MPTGPHDPVRERTFVLDSASVVASKHPQDVARRPNRAFTEPIGGDAEPFRQVGLNDESLSDSADIDRRRRYVHQQRFDIGVNRRVALTNFVSNYCIHRHIFLQDVQIRSNRVHLSAVDSERSSPSNRSFSMVNSLL